MAGGTEKVLLVCDGSIRFPENFGRVLYSWMIRNTGKCSGLRGREHLKTSVNPVRPDAETIDKRYCDILRAQE